MPYGLINTGHALRIINTVIALRIINTGIALRINYTLAMPYGLIIH